MAATKGRLAVGTASAAGFTVAGRNCDTTPAADLQSVAHDFIAKMFGPVTELPVYICSLPNDDSDTDETGERHVTTRMPGHITGFVTKWDRPKRGLFFCTGIVKRGDVRRAKDNIVQTIGLHADIDFKNLDGDPDRAEVLRLLTTRLKYQPSKIVFSGGGYHLYYLFKEALDTQENLERIELALRQLTDLVGGDLQCCEVSRVMRLPGTHNTKDGAWTAVEVVSDSGARYELDDLEEWLSEASPIMLRKTRATAQTAGESNWAIDYAQAHGHKPPIDVEARLNAMTYMGGEINGIHPTQLSVIASLLNSGMPIDDVVALVLAATKAAAGEYGARWNWKREECVGSRSIRGMCLSWIKKTANEKKIAPPSPSPKTGAAIAPANSEEFLALIFADRHQADLRFVAEWGQWFRWTACDG